MALEVVHTCPLGHRCEEAKDGVIHRCVWFIQLRGQNPNTGAEQDEQGCAMNWMPILLIENSKQQRSTAAAVESFRNDMVKANDQVLLGVGQGLLTREAS